MLLTHRLVILAIVVVFAHSALAQAPADLKRRVADLRQIPILLGLNVIRNAEGGRDAQVFCAWHDNGNAWGYHLYVVTMPKARVDQHPESNWSMVGIEDAPNGSVAAEVQDSPHSGEDAIVSVRFARATLDGKAATLLITAERDWKTSVPQPVVARIRIYVLKPSGGDPGITPDIFTPVISFTTQAKYSNANAALQSELGLPLSADK